MENGDYWEHHWHCVKSVRIRSFSGTYFPAFGPNTERYSVFSSNARKHGPEKLWIRTLFTQCKGLDKHLRRALVRIPISIVLINGRQFLGIWSHLLKKSLMKNFIFVQCSAVVTFFDTCLVTLANILSTSPLFFPSPFLGQSLK